MNINHWIRKNEHSRIKRLVDGYDFQKVRRILIHLNGDAPTTDELKKQASMVLHMANDTFDGEYKECGGFNFWASKNANGTFMLKFSLETWYQTKHDSEPKKIPS